MKTVSDALDIAEDRTGNFYKFSIGQWKRNHYDVKTLSSLTDYEISQEAFALLNKYSKITGESELRTNSHDFYFICLQDHQILRALRRDKRLKLLPFLVYIFTHELVHIVRFSTFLKRFETHGQSKEREEGLVHLTTYEILRNLSLPNLDYVLESYRGHRLHDPFLS